LLQTPLGQLTTLPQTLWLDFRGPTSNGTEGRARDEKGEGRGRDRRGGKKGGKNHTGTFFLQFQPV